ncbi:hypothetical protein B0T25DRAFT_634264 [Lasiosphaeria hispida]|uniref:Uncharacterized protein n=1 Tax=Lasiosphaeria hispida TaxID=260671 RepID=A0AAJ0MB44_9PEZI|nr:hypothetical protein B0T25DRAFT_634264 [Lasiosphaeria hispida]
MEGLLSHSLPHHFTQAQVYNEPIMATRTLTPAAEMSAAARGAPRKRGFTSISRSSYSSSSSGSSSFDDDIIDIPEVLDSSETLQFCGLNAEVSNRIFESWQQFQQTPGELGYGMSIFGEAKHFVKRMAEREDAWLPEHDWRCALTGMGADQRLCDAILNSAFDDVRKTRSASYWVLDTLNIGSEFLEGLDKRIRKKQEEMRHLATPSPSIQPRPAISNRPGLLGTYREPSVLRTATISAIPSAIEGRTMLFKGGAMTRLLSAFQNDGSIVVRPLQSASPTDFHRDSNYLVYLTKHLDVAEKYARFVQSRVPPEEGVILQFAVPSELLEDHRQIFGSEWRDLVFWSRGDSGSETVPAHLTRFAEAPILIGYIYGMSNEGIGRLSNPSDLTGQYMKTRDGGNASQHVFQTQAIRTQLVEQCRGWVWYQSMRYAGDFALRFMPHNEA